MLKKVVTSIGSSQVVSQARYSFVHKLVENVESEKQELFLDSENCILVNENDIPMGQSSKRDCHKVDDQQNIKLHRAFSVFLFNKKGEMLMQKRSSHKVCWIKIRNCNKDTRKRNKKIPTEKNWFFGRSFK